MEWEVFTLEDERLKVLGQEISSDVGRKILALLRERPMSPNDLSRELEVPLTTVVFHIEKLRDAGLIKPLVRMAGRRGQKTLYTLSSSAFVILPTSKEDKERIFETLRITMAIPRELIIRSAIAGLLIGILMLSPWYFLMVSHYGKQPREPAYAVLSENASAPNVTVEPMVKGPMISNETRVTEVSRSEELSWPLVFLTLGVMASMTSATVVVLMFKRRVVAPTRTPQS